MTPSILFLITKSFLLIFGLLAFVGFNLFIERWATQIISRGYYKNSQLNPILALLKLLTKETPSSPLVADRLLLALIPTLNFFFALLPAVVIPWSDPYILDGITYQSEMFTTSFGVLFFFALSSLAILTVLWAGWLPHKEIPTLSAMRAAYREISCKIPLLMIVFSMILFYRSSDFHQIVIMQDKDTWGIIRQPLAGFIFFIALIAEIGKPPFDAAENNHELNGAYLAEYSGVHRLFLILAEHINTLIFTVVFIHFFLGGYHVLPGLDSIIKDYPKTIFLVQGFSLLVKIAFLTLLYIVLKFSFVRFRQNDLMLFGQRQLLPLSFINLLVVILGQYYRQTGHFF